MKKLIVQGIRFTGLSGIGWILDFCTFTGLGLISENLFLNNMISSCVGVTFVFGFAAGKVFQDNGRMPLGLKYAVYLLYQCLLIILISKLLNGIHQRMILNFSDAPLASFSGILSKILVTPVSMVLNFFVMKGVIEKL